VPARNVLQYETWGWFTSQISTDGSGHANCGQASMIAAALALGLRSGDTPWQTLINEACMATRGYPDSPNNPYTSFSQMEDGFRYYGIDAALTYDYGTALQSSWSLVLVSGATIRLQDGSSWYPDNWFHGYEPDHFCLWGPYLQGTSYWCMNPLSYYPGDTWAIADPGKWQQAFGAAYLLYGMPLPAGEPAPAPPPEQLTAARFEMLQQGAIKPRPAHGGDNLIMLEPGQQGNDTGVRVNDESTPADPTLRWGRLQYGTQGRWYDGWMPSNKKMFKRLT
jgi:hypothetical protein